ncbi:MAG: phosphatidate cytidylyltransferase, partial [Candidatus Treponema excrementipullorum]|nr:phosphatidate cytidylyltransferase [Candidatus Treponema excrementipullorum]
MNGIETRQRINAIQKELFRKTIHMCAALVPLFLSFWYVPTMILLLLSLIVYSVAESLRYRGVEVPFISAITTVAARKRDENKFVLGPVTLVLGILFTAALFPPIPATVGILSLAFGDGLASLIGKLWGHIKIPFTKGK